MKTIGIDCQGGKGMAGYAINIAPTLASKSHGTPHAIAYIVDPLGSNSMKSPNPHSGFHQAFVANCLDTTTPCPNKGQGGMIILKLGDKG